MPNLKQEHCVTDTTALLYDIAVTLEKILAALNPAAPKEAQPVTGSGKLTPKPNQKR